jgi:hypothetical protein
VPLRCVDALVRCGQELVRPFPQQELVATEIIHRGGSDRCCCSHPREIHPQPSDSEETEVANNTKCNAGWMCLNRCCKQQPQLIKISRFQQGSKEEILCAQQMYGNLGTDNTLAKQPRGGVQTRKYVFGFRDPLWVSRGTFLFSLVPRFPSKSGLLNEHIVKHIYPVNMS